MPTRINTATMLNIIRDLGMVYTRRVHASTRPTHRLRNPSSPSKITCCVIMLCCVTRFTCIYLWCTVGFYCWCVSPPLRMARHAHYAGGVKSNANITLQKLQTPFSRTHAGMAIGSSQEQRTMRARARTCAIPDAQLVRLEFPWGHAPHQIHHVCKTRVEVSCVQCMCHHVQDQMPNETCARPSTSCARHHMK